MKKIIAALMIGIFCLVYFQGRSDSYARDKAVTLRDDTHLCSGEQIIAPSGRTFVLTAGHCAKIAHGGYMHAIDEHGKEHNLKVLEEDTVSDLLLLEGIPDMAGLHIAGAEYLHEHVRTFTHGNAMPVYKTEGELIGAKQVQIPIAEIKDDAEKAECTAMAKYMVDTDPIFGGSYCVLTVEEAITTAFIIPGSSGGMIVNDKGELVGVASATNGVFGFLVRLSDIQKFLAAR